MPEGPTIIIAKKNLQKFKGKRVVAAIGYTPAFEPAMLEGKVLTDIKSWGKHLLLCFGKLTVRVHFMLFGSYKIDEPGKRNAVLQLEFTNGILYFYVAKLLLIEDDLDKVYDWQADIMNDDFNPKKAIEKIKAKPGRMICDVLLDQQVFSGVGNIIKNEVLFRSKIHPASIADTIPPKRLKALIAETVAYSFKFLDQKQAGTLSRNWQAYEQEECPRNHVPFVKKDLGKTKRHCFYCERCQKCYN
ncbi:endonuclease [Mucilaginibacter sp. UR6-1]|uniref:DNA-formamidopyrimidine glycosylase family protein n=1 Tax=Mucilaginibacter sp. UR6-1 TaxID=1435643 RepID=UPI001E610205|nr:DNA-formamidopyrimidine glycosylase family protein [Mucilaginibacter sp. UR6-1]MCC8409881.1 endonuclease [Mucilaginibacter sp. UR6-1]